MRARTRSRPVAYGSPSRRASSTIRRSGSASIRQRYDPSDTMIGSVGVRISRPQSARRSTAAIRASCLSSVAASAVGAAHGCPGDQLVDGGLLHLDLAQGRQHRGDVPRGTPCSAR